MGEIVSSPLAKIAAFLTEHHYDGVLLRKRSNFAWITGGKDNHIVNTTENGVADLVFFSDKKYCITSKMESARIHDEELAGLGYEFVTPEWYEDQDAAVRALCVGKKIASDTALEPFDQLTAELAQLRFTLTETEQERYRWLGQKAANAVEETAREIKPGMTEFEIQAHLAAKVMKEGINPHVLLVSTDERVFRYRHPIPTAKKLENYAMIVICAEKWGLIANATRFVHFGPLPQELAENKQKLVQIDIAMNVATRPGTPIKEVLEKGFDMYREVGYGEDWRFLHQGGPTGYASREFLAAPDGPGIVHENQAFAWNPAIRGIKSEDTILVGKEENEIITHTGNWVYIKVEKHGKKFLRPDILVRDLE